MALPSRSRLSFFVGESGTGPTRSMRGAAGARLPVRAQSRRATSAAFRVKRRGNMVPVRGPGAQIVAGGIGLLPEVVELVAPGEFFLPRQFRGGRIG